ncbi:MAG: MBL fold metallo-hydrolase [Betaproteobacteria bacterium]|nr:MBL fold metallo-hydrolase [Betaproteobacteria bacterium]
MKFTLIPVTPYQQNCSLIWCETTRKAALVDPGGDVDRLLHAVEKAGVTLDKLLLTHGHLDHVGGAPELARRLGLPIYGPQEEDAFWLDALPEQCEMFGFPPTPAFRPDHWLHDGDRVQVGEVTLEVIHCPGHTPGHVVFFDEASRHAFVGDVLFQGSIGRTDFPRGNHAALLAAIRNKLFPLGDDVAFVPGHGGMSTFGEERRFNPFVGDAV